MTKACVTWVGFVLFPPSYLQPLLPLFSSPSLSLVCISYSSTSWHEHSSHTEMMKGWREIERKKARKRLRERLAGGRQVHKDEAGQRGGFWTERGRWDGMKQKHTKPCPVLLQRTKTNVFIVLWMHTGCLCH